MMRQAKRNPEEILRRYVSRKYKDPQIVLKDMKKDIESFKEEIRTEISEITRQLINIKKRI